MKSGGYYLIDFLDHSLGFNKLVKCRVIGKIQYIDETVVKIKIWEILNLRGKNKQDNEELVSIVRSTILKSKRIRI